jgi:hypothetical protein
MRLLNKCTEADPYPLPTVEEMHAAMGGCKLWSKMDYVSGFGRLKSIRTTAISSKDADRVRHLERCAAQKWCVSSKSAV